MFLDWKSEYCYDGNSSQINTESVQSLQNPSWFFPDIDKRIPKCTWRAKPNVNKASMRKKKLEDSPSSNSLISKPATKLQSSRQMPYDISYMWKVKYDKNEPIYEAETESWI